jgi:hypothetical protein
MDLDFEYNYREGVERRKNARARRIAHGSHGRARKEKHGVGNHLCPSVLSVVKFPAKFMQLGGGIAR